MRTLRARALQQVVSKDKSAPANSEEAPVRTRTTKMGQIQRDGEAYPR